MCIAQREEEEEEKFLYTCGERRTQQLVLWCAVHWILGMKDGLTCFVLMGFCVAGSGVICSPNCLFGWLVAAGAAVIPVSGPRARAPGAPCGALVRHVVRHQGQEQQLTADGLLNLATGYSRHWRMILESLSICLTGRSRGCAPMQPLLLQPVTAAAMHHMLQCNNRHSVNKRAYACHMHRCLLAVECSWRHINDGSAALGS